MTLISRLASISHTGNNFACRGILSRPGTKTVKEMLSIMLRSSAGATIDEKTSIYAVNQANVKRCSELQPRKQRKRNIVHILELSF